MQDWADRLVQHAADGGVNHVTILQGTEPPWPAPGGCWFLPGPGIDVAIELIPEADGLWINAEQKTYTPPEVQALIAALQAWVQAQAPPPILVFETDARKAKFAELRRLLDDWPPPSRAERVRRWARRLLRIGPA